MYDILKTISGPEDVKKLSMDQLHTLSNEMREALFNRLTKIGGHFGPNFGMVEAEIAMHYVFDSPNDKFVFDVSHQSYPHKMLTGRWQGYVEDEHFLEDSGYTNPNESEHDFFNVGHTSTSITLALGLAKARDLKGMHENVVAVIGDGSLSGGQALAGLNVAGEMHSNFIILVNDNEMAIAETHGGLYKSLQDLRTSKGTSANNTFKTFGLDYIYEENGNDIESMIAVFEKVKDIDHPIVVHMHTQKGKGYEMAEQNKEAWHWCLPFDRKTGLPTVDFGQGENYLTMTQNYILEKAKADPKFVVITPAMPGSIGLMPEQREQLKDQYVDTGISEEAAVSMASGVARNGGKPLVITNMTFIQRAYDQISQDVCINNNPVTMVMNFSSFDGLTDVTHLGIFGLSTFINIPNLVVLAPTCVEEYKTMLDWSVDQTEHPVLILIPGNEPVHRDVDITYEDLKYRIEQQGEKVAILALGDFYQRGQELAQAIEENFGFQPTLIDPRFASNVDEDMLKRLETNHEIVITLEDGVLDGGFGEKISRFYGAKPMKVKNYGLQKVFYDRYDPAKLLEELGMTSPQIIEEIKQMI